MSNHQQEVSNNTLTTTSFRDSARSGISTTYADVDETEQFRPPAVFRRGYRVLTEYEETRFGGVTLKQTRNGRLAKSGVSLERDISPKR